MGEVLITNAQTGAVLAQIMGPLDALAEDAGEEVRDAIRDGVLAVKVQVALDE